jgi:peptidase M28-like protein
MRSRMASLFLAWFVIALSIATHVRAQDQPPAGRGASGRGRGAQARVKEGPWFGLPLPPPLGAEPAVIVGDRQPRPFVMPDGEPAAPELAGATIRKDLEAIVGISKESRATHEVGSGQMWGRITGLPSGAKAIDYAVAEWRKAGIGDIRVQPIASETSFWLPLSWEVRLIGDAAFGAGTQDVVLHSALPVGPSNIPGGTLTAPLVFVGTANPSILQHIDVKGKIAVHLSIPQGHMLFERGPVGERAADLVARGAVGVFNLIRLPGNEFGRDFSNCGNPCVNIGGRDGHFLEQVLDRASQAGKDVRAAITLRTETRTGLTAKNAVAVVPGTNTEEAILIDAHVDGWFDGAGDNADGFSVMLALARHFAKPQNKPARTLVFIASAGHHSPGLNGPASFVRANPDLVKKAILAINIEHVAQRNFSPARSTASDGYRQAIADSGEAPTYAGITNGSAFIDALFQQGITRYGVNFVSEKSQMLSGESGGFTSVGAIVTIIQAPPLYHTTGETLDVISTPGLERVARFFAYLVKEVAKAPRAQVKPPTASMR